MVPHKHMPAARRFRRGLYLFRRWPEIDAAVCVSILAACIVSWLAFFRSHVNILWLIGAVVVAEWAWHLARGWMLRRVIFPNEDQFAFGLQWIDSMERKQPMKYLTLQKWEQEVVDSLSSSPGVVGAEARSIAESR